MLGTPHGQVHGAGQRRVPAAVVPFSNDVLTKTTTYTMKSQKNVHFSHQKLLIWNIFFTIGKINRDISKINYTLYIGAAKFSNTYSIKILGAAGFLNASYNMTLEPRDFSALNE